MRRSLREILAGSFLLLVLLTGLALTFAYFHLRASVQGLRGTARLPGLGGAVTVHLDAFAIPHVYAGSMEDAFRAQGYLHAAERLWQMDLLRRTAQGRLAELFGPEALPVDRLVRTLDLWGAGERSLEALPDDVRRLVEAYAEGVNAKLEDWSGPLPPEFLLLRFRPEPWDPVASVAVGRAMALDLSTWWNEIARLRASVELDEERLRYLALPYPEWGPTIVEERWPGVPDRASPGGSERAAAGGGVRERAAGGGATRRGAGGGPDAWDPFRFLSELSLSSSNAWAVAGVRSAVGLPLLASDMHLALRAPSTWYVVALHAEEPELHVAGVSLPGVPGVVVGYNRQIAWGFTNGYVDDMDFVVEAVSLDRSAYRLGDEWVPFAVRPETLRVRGRDEPLVHPVRETARGPVISDVLPDVGVTLSALWAGRRRTAEAVGLLGMNRATDAAEFDRAIQAFGSPHQNVIYATARGTLGYRLSGSVPIREGWDGSVPVSFERVGSGWRGFWPPEALPWAVDPPAGYLASANNLQAPGAFGVIGTDYPLPFRARRIVERLEGETGWSVDLMRRLQLDTRSGLAERVGGRVVAAASRIGADSVAERLSAWDRRVTVESREATLFHVWLYRLRALIAADEFEGLREWEFFPDAALLRILEDGGGPWVDDVRTAEVETLEELEERAMEEAIRVAAGRRWGEVHRERSAHPLGRSVWLDRVFGFNVGPYPSRGGPHTVRPDDPRRWTPLDSTSWKPPFLNEYGPSERFVAEMGPGRSIGHFLLPTGQSGNPFSPHYRDMASRWPEAELIPVPLHREEARGRAVRSLQLIPR